MPKQQWMPARLHDLCQHEDTVVEFSSVSTWFSNSVLSLCTSFVTRSLEDTRFKSILKHWNCWKILGLTRKPYLPGRLKLCTTLYFSSCARALGLLKIFQNLGRKQKLFSCMQKSPWKEAKRWWLHWATSALSNIKNPSPSLKQCEGAKTMPFYS